MTKIKNKEVYPLKQYPVLSDFVIGSDSENEGTTVNFSIGSIINMFDGLIDYKFTDSPLDITSPEFDGYFKTVGGTDFALVTHLYISRKTLSGQDLSAFFNFLKINFTEFTLFLVNKQDRNIFAYLAITAITEQTDYYDFTVQIVDGDNYLGQLEDLQIYSFNYEKNATGDPTSIITQIVASGDTIHAPSGDAVFNFVNGLDANALHKTGNESFTGIKSSTNTSATQINGLSLSNSGTTGSRVLLIANSNTGAGGVINNSGIGDGLFLNNSSTGQGTTIINSAAGRGINIDNQLSGKGIIILNSGASTGNALEINNTFSGNGFRLFNQSTGNGQFITNNAGGTAINLNNSGAGTALFIGNGTGKGIDLTNLSTGIGATLTNNSSGILSILNSVGSSAGDLIQFQKNSTITTKVDQNGIISTPPPIISTTPTTSAGSYDLLTRNTATGQVEKILSSSVVTGSGVNGRVTFWNGTNSLSSDAGFLWDNSLKTLGIGAPATVALDISGTTFASTQIRSTTISNTDNAVLSIRRARAATTAVLANDILGGIAWRGYDGTSYGSAVASINVTTPQNYTTSIRPASINFLVTPRDSNVPINPFNIFGSSVNVDFDFANPTNIQSAFYSNVLGKGDNATYKGVAAGNFLAKDRPDVTSLNKGVLLGINVSVFPIVNRNNVPFDDANAVNVNNDGTGKATDAFYISKNAGFGGSQWSTLFTSDANSDYGIRLMGTHSVEYLNFGNLLKVNNLGILSMLPPIITTVPTTSAGTYDILTRNISTGQVEKILSTAVASSARTLNINGVVQDLTANREWRTAQASTGILNYGGISIASGTTVNIGAAFGYIVNNESNPLIPTYTAVTYPGAINVTVPTLGTGLASYVLLNSAGALVFQNTFPTSAQRKSMIFLSKIGHPVGVITTAGDEPDFMTSPLSQFRDLFQAFNYVNQGVYSSANGANLNINLSAGTIVGDGINFVTDKTNPNNLTVASSVAATFLRRTQTGNGGAATTLIDPANYDVAGTITPVGGGGGRSTIQYVYYVPGLGMVIQYGQTFYANLVDAIAAVGRETFVVYPSLIRNAILIGMIALRRDATNLSDPAQAQFFRADIFGQTGGATSGVSTTTLQLAYNNSAVPQIAVTDLLGAFTIKNSRALDSSNVQEWQNIAGSTVMSITGAGLLQSVNTGATSISGISLTNNGSSNTQVLTISNTAGGRGILLTNAAAGTGLVTANNGTGTGLYTNNTSTGLGLSADNQSTGVLVNLNSVTASTGDLLRFQKNAVTTLRVDADGMLRGTNSGSSSTVGIDMLNSSSTAGTSVINVNNSNIGRGISVLNSSTGLGILINNTSGGAGLFGSNGSTGQAISVENISTGTLFNLNSQTASTGNLLTFRKNNVTTAFFDQNGLFTSSNSGATSIQGILLTNNGTTGTKVLTVNNTSTGRGIEISNNSTGAGQVISNSGAGTGMYVVNAIGGTAINGDNSSTGAWLSINSQTGSTGDLLIFRKNSTFTAKFDQNGVLTIPSGIISVAPTTSAGTYDILTRNTSTGVIEKINALDPLEFNASDATVWNNGKANSQTNTSFGDLALRSYTATSNTFNTAIGYSAMTAATTGTNNTAIGYFALSAITNQAENTALGTNALRAATSALNTAVGSNAAGGTTNGVGNVAMGAQCFANNTTGNNTVAIGTDAARFISGGITANTSSDQSVFIGNACAPLAVAQTNQIVIGYQAVGRGSNTTQIGNSNTTDSYISGNLNGVKVYNALITQSSTGAPTVSILGQNGIGAIVWTRTATGSYTGTLSSAFTANKTMCFVNNTVLGSITFQQTSANTVVITTADSTGTLLDGRLTNNSIRIEVYP